MQEVPIGGPVDNLCLEEAVNKKAAKAAVWRSRDFQQINKTEIARKRLEIREKLQSNTIGKPGLGCQDPLCTLTYTTPPSSRFDVARFSVI